MKYTELSDAECRDLLARARVGRLGCVRDNRPYVVPITFSFEDGCAYSFATHGRKIEWMRANPYVCLEADEIIDFNDWASVILFGRYEELGERPEWEAERATAARLILKHGEWLEPAYDAARLRTGASRLEPVLYRIRAEEITGRRSRPFAPDIY